ncbi:MAG: LysR family transcriptional regulator ArgP [Rhodobacteraceae bacterium]|nr:LysR family transcriptional regulator ArgP [Paracoccaceae bacterium]
MSFDPTHLAALAAILRHGSFEAAASELNITPSAVSQRLKALENKMGTPMVIRDIPCRPTPAGQRLARHAQDLSLLEAQVAKDLGMGSAPARVRVALNADSLATWFIPALVGHEMLFEIEVDDQDHSAEWLHQGAVAAAVTARETPVRGCTCHALGSVRYIPTASPEFMARWFPDGITDKALARAPMLTFNAKDQLQVSWIKQATGHVLRPPTHTLPSTQAFIEAARAGLGWGMNPLILVEPHLMRRDLVPLIDGSFLDTPLYWQVARHVADPLRTLTAAVRRTARSTLVQPNER